MRLGEFEKQIKAPGVKGRATLMSVLWSIAKDGVVLPEYQPYLDGAETYLDFLEAIYADDAIVMDDVWGYAAKLLHPEAALMLFEPLAVEHDVPVNCGSVSFDCNDGTAIGMRAPSNCDTVDVMVYEDGALNELALKPAGKLAANFTVAGIPVNGKFSVYHGPSNQLVIMRWFIDEFGMRPKARELSSARAGNTVKPKSGNC